MQKRTRLLGKRVLLRGEAGGYGEPLMQYNNRALQIQIKKAISPDRHTPCSHKYLCNRSKGCMTKIPIFVECTKSE